MELLDGLVHSYMNIGYGIGLAVIVAGALLFVVFAIKNGNSISPFCYLISIILTPLLVFQLSLMFGGISVKGEVKDIENRINEYAQLLVMGDTGFESIDDIYDLISEFQDLLPGLSSEIGSLTIGQVDKNDIGGSLMKPARSHVNKYILFRILWSLLFSVAALTAMIILSDGGGTSNYRKSHIRNERVTSRRSSEGRRPSRRTRRY